MMLLKAFAIAVVFTLIGFIAGVWWLLCWLDREIQSVFFPENEQ